MPCRDCGKSSRYGNTIVHTGDVDARPSSQQEVPARGFNHPGGEVNPIEQLAGLSFEELVQRGEELKTGIRNNMDSVFEQMSDPVKRFYILNLVDTANGGFVANEMQSPAQALRTLNYLLEHKEFLFINDLYPSLKGQVDKKVEELDKNKIII